MWKKFAVGELASPRLDQSATWLTVSSFVGELSSKRVLPLPAGGGVQHHLSLVAKTQYTTPPWCHGEAGVRLQSPYSPAPSTPSIIVDDRARPLTWTPFDHASASSY